MRDLVYIENLQCLQWRLKKIPWWSVKFRKHHHNKNRVHMLVDSTRTHSLVLGDKILQVTSSLFIVTLYITLGNQFTMVYHGQSEPVRPVWFPQDPIPLCWGLSRNVPLPSRDLWVAQISQQSNRLEFPLAQKGLLESSQPKESNTFSGAGCRPTPLHHLHRKSMNPSWICCGPRKHLVF